MNLSCRANSMLLIGEKGVGKTLVARKLAETTALPVIIFDELIFLPKNIFSKIPSFTKEQKEYCKRMERLRKLFPDLNNANDLGYSNEIATKIKDRYGERGLEFYIKYFEIQIFNQFIENLKFPVIIDTNSNLPKYEETGWKNFLSKLCAENVDLYKKGFKKHNMINSSIIERTLQKVGKIIYLYKKELTKSDETHRLARKRLKSFFDEPDEQNSYKKIATKSIDTNLLIRNNNLDEGQLNLIVAKILDKKENQKIIETPPADTNRIDKISLILK